MSRCWSGAGCCPRRPSEASGEWKRCEEQLLGLLVSDQLRSEGARALAAALFALIQMLVRSDPTRTFKGILHRNRIGGEATPQKDDNNEAEPVVTAYVSIDDDAIPEDKRIPRDLLTTGTEVVAKVRCGDAALGYSLFYGVWEFLCEKVLFSF